MAALAAALGTGAAGAQSALPQLETIELTEPLHQNLAFLQDQWLEWLTAYHARDPEAAAEVLSEISLVMADLRVKRLSDLSIGAALSAVQAARASDFERAQWALEAAELLDPKRPENSFAAATIARLEGNRLEAIGRQLQGYMRMLSFPWERTIVAHDLLLWIFYILALSAAAFVILLASTRGAIFFRDLTFLLERRVGSTGARVLALVLVFFPLLLPNGLAWLILYWTLVFWGYASKSERWVLVGVWLLIALLPEVVSEQAERVKVFTSPPLRAMHSLGVNRLEGSLLTDLGELRVALPQSYAVKHLLADVHQQLGQLEFARSVYLEVVDAEPENGAAMLNLGTFYFRVADYATAVQLFQRASADEQVAAAAFFNLSQAYSASYLFEQSEQTLRQAQEADGKAVSRWVLNSDNVQVTTVLGGLARMDEIRDELESSWNPTRTRSGFFERLLRSLTWRLVVLVALVAIGLEWFARPRGFYRARSEVVREEKRGSRRYLSRILVPGMEQSLERHGGRTVLALLLPISLLTLPLASSLGYRVPWGFEPGNSLAWMIAIIGLLLYISARVLRGLRE